MNTPVTLFGNKPVFAARPSMNAPELSAQPAPSAADDMTGLPSMPKPYFASSHSAVRFGGLIDEDYHVEMRIEEPVNANTASAVLQALLVRNQVKNAKGDSSSLKLFIDSQDSDWFKPTSRATLADTMALVNRPVDVVVKEDVSDMGLMALLSATGKRFAYDGARLGMGPIVAAAPYGRNDDHAVRREFYNEYVRDLEHVVMSRAGVDSREQVNSDLNSARNMNALQALAYGKKGLIDAVIVGFDRVVTREGLDRYMAEQGFDEAQKKDFLVNAMRNTKKLPTVSLAEFSAESIPTAAADSPVPDLVTYKSPKAVLAEAKAKEKEKEEKAEARKAVLKAAEEAGTPPPPEEEDDEPETLAFFKDCEDKGCQKIEPGKIPLGKRIKAKELKTGEMTMDNLPGKRSYLDDDVIFFNDGFVDETAEPMTDNLRELDRKKRSETNPSNIKVIVNSPGGSIASGLDIRSTMAHSKTPVDVVVTGMAASCGAFLVSSATGNRLATPNARIMIHDAWWSRPYEPDQLFNENIDSLDDISHAFVQAISDAAGRSFEDVWKDMKIDIWLNPLESMFYGDKGLTDAVLVGNNKVITRQNVYDYLVSTLGGKEKADQYLKDKIESLRVGKRNWKASEHDENDPLGNPLKTIQKVAALSAKPLNEVPSLAASAPRDGNPAEHRTVVLPNDGKGNALVSEKSAAVLADLRERFMPSPRKI